MSYTVICMFTQLTAMVSIMILYHSELEMVVHAAGIDDDLVLMLWLP